MAPAKAGGGAAQIAVLSLRSLGKVSSTSDLIEGSLRTGLPVGRGDWQADA